MRIIIRGWTKEGYHKDILSASERQIHSYCEPGRVTVDGFRIDPKDFPEMEYFTLIIEGVCGIAR